MKDFSKRIPELDIARGIAVILMILDHFFFDLWGLMPDLFVELRGSSISKFAYRYWVWDVRIYIRYVILAVFMLLTGICCSLSHSNLIRGLKLMGVALLLTVATNIISQITAQSDFTITFGVLHCIALALILVGILEKLIKSKWFYLILGVLMTVLGIYFYQGSYFASYSSENFFVLMLKQIAGICYCGSDSFSFLLFGGQIFIGVFFGIQFYSKKKSIFKNAKYPTSIVGRMVCFVGRNSLIVYFAHQIIIPVLLFVILLICGYKPNL